MKQMIVEPCGDGKRIIVSRSNNLLIHKVRNVLHESPVAIDILELDFQSEGEVKFLYRHSGLADAGDIQGLNEYLEALIPK